MYTDKDYEDADAFRDMIHAEALAKVRAEVPDAAYVIDRCPVDAYLQQHWDYPGAWHTIVAVPEEFGSRDELVARIVRDTLADLRPTDGRTPEKRKPWMHI